MAAYATDADLAKLIPNIMNQGVVTFDDQLTFATDDVIAMIKAEWWPKAVNRRYGTVESVDFSPLFPTIDLTKINEAVLVNLTCYRALSRYIMPMLTKDSGPNDTWAAKIPRYNTFFNDEWQKVSQLPLYDFNADGQFSDIERRGSRTRKLVRA